MKPTRQSTALLTFVVSALLPISAFGEIIASGSLTDKSGDSKGEDLISATVTVDDQSMVTFEVRFTKSSFVPGQSNAGFCLDLDKNTKTGFGGVNSGNDDSRLIGVDAMINLPNYSSNHARTTLWDKQGKDLTYGKTKYPITTFDDGYSMTIPIADLGATASTMNFKVTGSRALSDHSSSGVFDYMSEIGAPVGTVALTVRIPITRIWTDATSGRTLEGILQSKSPDGSELKIKRKDNGSVVTLKTERLLEADREFIKTWKP